MEYTQEELDKLVADKIAEATKGMYTEDDLQRKVTAEVDRRVESGIQKGLETQKKKWQEEFEKSATMTAEELAKKKLEEQEKARKAGLEVIADYEGKLTDNQKALAAISAGKIKSQEQLNRFLEDEAYWRGINKQIQEGTLSLTDAQIAKLKEVRDELATTNEKMGEQFKYQLQKIDEVFKDGVIGQLGSAFDALWEGQNVKFGEMLREMGKQLLKSMVFNYIMNGLNNQGWGWGSFMSANGFAKGGAFNNGVQMFATGGVVNRATPFGMAGGGLGERRRDRPAVLRSQTVLDRPHTLPVQTPGPVGDMRPCEVTQLILRCRREGTRGRVIRGRTLVERNADGGLDAHGVTSGVNSVVGQASGSRAAMAARPGTSARRKVIRQAVAVGAVQVAPVARLLASRSHFTAAG